MTKNEVDKASEPQLDVWVAVHGMGWTAETSSDGRSWWLRDDGQKILQREWSPSTAIGDAWTALEALPEEWVIRRLSRIADEPRPRRYCCQLYRGEARRTADVYVDGPAPAIVVTRAVLHASLLTGDS